MKPLHQRVISVKLLLSIFALGLLGASYLVGINKAEAFVTFDFDHDCSVATPCQPVGQLSYEVWIPNSVPPNASVPIDFVGTAIEPLYAVPICPLFRYGVHELSSMGSMFPLSGVADPCYGKNTFLDSNYLPVYFTAPATPGTYNFCSEGGMSNPEYMLVGGSQCMTYTVAGLPEGTVSVTSNNVGASWTITGPSPLITGSGTTGNYPGRSVGTYTIVWGDVSGYTKPSNQSLTLLAGDTITFSGNYVASPAIDLNFR